MSLKTGLDGRLIIPWVFTEESERGSMATINCGRPLIENSPKLVSSSARRNPRFSVWSAQEARYESTGELEITSRGIEKIFSFSKI